MAYDSASPAPVVSDIATELSSRRTGMSFQRTRMSADRTLMSVIRTSLSLIGFGFSIHQVFDELAVAGVIRGGVHSARRFGVSLIALGIALLVMGILYHVQFMTGLRRVRGEMKAAGLVHAESVFPPSLTLITAVVLLLIGIVAILSIV